MKRPSEGELGTALRGMDLEPYVLRIPDPKTGAGVANWKPCDFLVWWREPEYNHPSEEIGSHSAWVEGKDTDAVNTFPLADLRPSQLAGIREAWRLDIPYLLAIYWRRAKRWTISDAAKVLGWIEDQVDPMPTSIPRTLLMSRFGVDAAPRDLGQTIKAILEDGW